MDVGFSDEHVETWTIRAATPDDAPTLVAFTLSEAFDAERRTLDRSDVERGVAGAFDTPPRARYWVVERDGRLVGSVSIVTEWSNFRGGDYWWIQSLYILPEERGQGMVDRMLGAVEWQARAAGALDLRLYGVDTNARALAAYRRCGFRRSPYLILTKSLLD